MKVKLSKWGNSLAVRIPTPVVDEAELQEGASVNIEAESDGGIRLTPIKTVPSVEELIDGITEDNCHEATEWGEPLGNEAW